MDITSAQLGDQNPWSRYTPVLGLSALALLWIAAASFTLFQLIRAAGEARFVSQLQLGWLGYGLGLTVLCLTHIHRTGRANKRRAAELAEIRNLLAAEIEARQRAEARLRQNQHELSEGETRYPDHPGDHGQRHYRGGPTWPHRAIQQGRREHDRLPCGRGYWQEHEGALAAQPAA